MKPIRYALFIIVFCSGLHFVQACTSVVVGKEAGADGAVLFAHNEDDSGRRIVHLWRAERQLHNQNEAITLKRGAVISQAKETWACFWYQMPGLEFSDFYMNEWGVTVASNACPSREDRPETVSGGIGYWLRRIVAQRARSAKEGVRIAGTLLDSLGYAGTGRTLVICDPNEGWLLSMIGGKHWLAQRVPDDEAVVLPNRYIIGEVDFSDSARFVFCKADLKHYAAERGWHDPEKAEFHFANTFSKNNPDENDLRQWRGQQLLLGRSDQKAHSRDLPFSVRPNGKVTLQRLMQICRDHYEGTDYAADLMAESRDDYRFSTPNPNRMEPRPICTFYTQYSVIAQLRNWLPWPVGATAWLSFGRPDCHPYLPWYVGQTRASSVYQPRSDSIGVDLALSIQFETKPGIFKYDPRHAFWVYNELEHMVDVNYIKGIEKARPVRDAIETRLIDFQSEFENSVLKLWSRDKDEARMYIDDLNQSVTEESLQKAKYLIRKLKSEFYH